MLRMYRRTKFINIRAMRQRPIPLPICAERQVVSLDDPLQPFDWREPIMVALMVDAGIALLGWVVAPWLFHSMTATPFAMRYGSWILGVVGLQGLWIQMGGTGIGY
jgi:hypothetical protein